MDLQITPGHGNSSDQPDYPVRCRANTPRRAILDARALAWERRAAPGPFLDGARRIEMAAEVRHARSCSLCADRKAAPAPHAVAGAHDTRGHLGAGEVEV